MLGCDAWAVCHAQVCPGRAHAHHGHGHLILQPTHVTGWFNRFALSAVLTAAGNLVQKCGASVVPTWSYSFVFVAWPLIIPACSTLQVQQHSLSRRMLRRCIIDLGISWEWNVLHVAFGLNTGWTCVSAWVQVIAVHDQKDRTVCMAAAPRLRDGLLDAEPCPTELGCSAGHGSAAPRCDSADTGNVTRAFW